MFEILHRLYENYLGLNSNYVKSLNLIMDEQPVDYNLDEDERKEAKKRSEESMNFMYFLQQEGTNCDVTLHTEDGGNFPIHSAIMCRCSPYFQALFTTSLDGQKRRDITLPGIDSDCMRLIIQYAYTRKVAITLQNASDLMVDADQFGVLTLVDQCGQFMMNHLEPANCVEVYRFARNYFFQKLANHAYQYIMRYFRVVSKESSELLYLSLEELIEMIDCDELNVNNEAIVWEAVVRWIDFEPEMRAAHVAILLKHVRLGLLNPPYFREKVQKHPYVKQHENECRSIVIRTLVHLEELSQNDNGVPSTRAFSRPRIPHQLLFAVGGWSGGNPTEMVETYDIRADKWTHTFIEDSPGPRAYHGCVVIGGDIYVIGGFDGMEYFNGCWCFNVSVQCWREIAPMHCQRCYVSVANIDSLIYAMGGYNGQHRQNTAEVYNPATNQWNYIAPMHMQRSDADATTYSRKVYIVGGFNGQTCMNSAEVYDPLTNQWTMLAPMRIQRSGVSCAAYEGCIYAVGGFNGAMRLRSAEKYDTCRGTWAPVADMVHVRSNFGIEVLEDRIYAIGGFNGVTTVNEVEYYDGRFNTWQQCTNMNIVRSALAACIVTGLENIYSYLEFDRGGLLSREHRRRSSSGGSSNSSGLERSASE